MMGFTILCITIYFVVAVIALKDIGRLNLVKVDLPDVSYKKLMTNEDGVLSVPPLAILDVVKLKDYQCFQNLRSNKWSLALPIIFWNQSYIDKIVNSVSTIEFFRKFPVNISSLVLPPSGILAYRLGWRRKSEIYDNNNVVIDNSWYTTQFDYVMPRVQNFIIEFDSQNSSFSRCNATKHKLLNETFQAQELSVAFMTRKMKAQNISKIHVTLSDIIETKMFNDTGCQSKDKCYVSYKYAEKWSYEVSSNIMAKLNVVHLSLQKDLYDAVLNYLCKDKVPISEIESQTITKLVKDSSNEMGCAVGKKVYSTLEKLCNDRIFSHNSYYYGTQCFQQNINYKSEIIASMSSTKIIDDRNVFNIAVKRW